MADIDNFTIQTGYKNLGTSKKSGILHRFQVDKVILKHMSKDGLAALMLKKQNKMPSRSALNDELIQNIKKAQLATKKFQEIMTSLPDIQLANKSKVSIASEPSSSHAMRTMSPTLENSALHGFRFRSDGNIRLSRKNSVDNKVGAYEKLSQRDLTYLKQTLLKWTMIHSRDANGDYIYSPLLNELMKNESSRIASKTSELAESFDVFRFMANDSKPQAVIENDEFVKNVHPRDRLLIGRRFYVRENDRFINEMMQNIYLLERHADLYKQFTNVCQRYADSFDNEIPLRRSKVLYKSDSGLKTPRYLSSRHTSMTGITPQTRSSLNMRYGMSSQAVDSQKLLLQQCIDAEMKKVSKTDLEIDGFIKDLERVIYEKEKKNIKVQPNRKIPFDLWKAESKNILDFPDNTPETSALETIQN